MKTSSLSPAPTGSAAGVPQDAPPVKTRPAGTLSSTPLREEFDRLDKGLARVAIPEPSWDLATLDAPLLARLRLQWTLRMQVEHRSSMVFAQLAHQLVEADAFLDEQAVMLRMAQDELRHTATCARVLAALDAPNPPPLPTEPLARHAGITPEARALRNVIFTTCISEMVACARFVATLDHTTDEPMRGVLRALLSDEVLHGRFGFYYLESRADLLVSDHTLRAGLERFLTHAFAVAERELAPAPPHRKSSELELAFGLEDPALAHEVFFGTIEHAVVPGLARFGLDASSAWRERRLLT